MTLQNFAPSDRDAALRMKADCPWCGGEKTVAVVEATVVEQFHPGYHVIGTELPTKERECLAAACSRCEFCAEVMR